MDEKAYYKKVYLQDYNEKDIIYKIEGSSKLWNGNTMQICLELSEECMYFFEVQN